MICPQVNSREDGRQLRCYECQTGQLCKEHWWCNVVQYGAEWTTWVWGGMTVKCNTHTHAKSEEVTECLVVMWKLKYPEKSKVWHDIGYQWQQWNALAQLWTFCTTILVKNYHIYTNRRTFLSSKTILYSEDRSRSRLANKNALQGEFASGKNYANATSIHFRTPLTLNTKLQGECCGNCSVVLSLSKCMAM